MDINGSRLDRCEYIWITSYSREGGHWEIMSCLFEDRIEPTFKSWRHLQARMVFFWVNQCREDQIERQEAAAEMMPRRQMNLSEVYQSVWLCTEEIWLDWMIPWFWMSVFQLPDLARRQTVSIKFESWEKLGGAPFCFGRQPQGCDLQDLKEDMEKFRCPAWIERWWKRLARNHGKVQIVISMSYSFGHTFNSTILDVTGNILLKRKFHVGPVMTQTPNDSRFGMITLRVIAGPCFAR